MLSLHDVQAGRTCIIVWLLGQMGDYLHEACNFTEDDTLNILSNDCCGMIVCHGNHRYALGPEAAEAVKVTLI